MNDINRVQIVRNAPWNLEEVSAAVEAYFSMHQSQMAGRSINKAKVYQSLANDNPNRSAKAFERKFQNISAILLELNMPYCSGLRPYGNYQRLLKKVVLDYPNENSIRNGVPYKR